MKETTKVRQPKQERSIETKNKIIQAGYKVFSTVGYYGTNTAEIAKVAGVSTGIVYGYFKDKRDILLCVLDIYINTVTQPIFGVMDKLSGTVDMASLMPVMIDEVIKIHEENERLHHTLHSLAANDEGVNAKFIDLEKTVTEKITVRLTELGMGGDNLPEKVHVAMNVVQAFAHEYVFDKHDYVDYVVMRDLVCKITVDLF